MQTIKSKILLVILNNILLLISFFLIGEFSIFFAGAAIFFATSYFLRKENRTWKVLTLSILPFLVVVFVYFVTSGVMKNQDFPNPLGFLIYLSVFLISFFVGSKIFGLIKNEEVSLLVFVSIFLILISNVSANFGHSFALSFSGIAYLIGSIILLQRTQIKLLWLFIILFLSYCLVFVGIAWLEGGMVQISFPKIIFISFCIISANIIVQFYKKGKKTAAGFTLFTVFVFALVGYVGMMNYMQNIYSKINVLPDKKVELNFIDSDDKILSTEQMKGKIVVLDFWSTTCSVCFKKFPEFEKFYNKNISRGDIEIYAVNVPFRTSDSIPEIRRIITKLDYSFPFLIAKDAYSYYEEELLVQGVPHLTILDKSGEIIFNGSFNNNDLVWVDNLQRMIDTIR